MDDYIERQTLYTQIAELEEKARDRYLNTPWDNPAKEKYQAQLNERTALKHLVADAPSANVRSVVYGEWKEYSGADAGFHYCSVCKGQAFNYGENDETIEVLSDFCPYCGAYMRSKKVQENE